MKNNKGFTLIELLAVLVLIGVVTSIGSFSVIAVRKQIKQDLWDSKVDLIEERARTYGEDNKNRLNNSCTVDGKSYTNCLSITVQTLIDKNYLSTKERDDDDKKVVINDTKDKNDSKDKDNSGYYANDMKIYIYLDDNMVYAKLEQ